MHGNNVAAGAALGYQGRSGLLVGNGFRRLRQVFVASARRGDRRCEWQLTVRCGQPIGFAADQAAGSRLRCSGFGILERDPLGQQHERK